MSFDGIVTRAMTNELDTLLRGGRINRIHQPGAALLRLDVYAGGKNYKLLLDTAGNTPYVYIADHVPENPEKPPQFCMVLRKHLQGGRIRAIRQIGIDRVMQWEIDTRDELGVETKKVLLAELMGKYANIFLLDARQTIIEPMKRISGDISSVRPVYPCMPYTGFPSGKVSLLDTLLLPGENEALRIQKWLLQSYEGFGPPLTRELCYQAEIDPSRPASALTGPERTRLEKTLADFREKLLSHSYQPSIMGAGKAFYAYPLHHLGEDIRACPSMSACVESYRLKKQEQAPTDSPGRGLTQTVRRLLERAQAKAAKMQNEYEDSLDREKDLLYADLLSAHSHAVQRGATEVEVLNYFDENTPMIAIPLDPKKNVWQNAQKFYKAHSKKKSREKRLAVLLPRVESEIAYFRQVLQDLSLVQTREEADEIRAELTDEGILRKKGPQKKRRESSRPYQFVSSDGYTIYVGKNSRQNDQLTMRTAGKDDFFFHAKDVPGSHVIVRADKEPLPKRTQMEAAWLAALYSSEKEENHVLVDYTRKKNVRKQKGAKPGQVLYDPYDTVTVDLKNPASRPEQRKG